MKFRFVIELQVQSDKYQTKISSIHRTVNSEHGGLAESPSSQILSTTSVISRVTQFCLSDYEIAFVRYYEAVKTKLTWVHHFAIFHPENLM